MGSDPVTIPDGVMQYVNGIFTEALADREAAVSAGAGMRQAAADSGLLGIPGNVGGDVSFRAKWLADHWGDGIAEKLHLSPEQAITALHLAAIDRKTAELAIQTPQTQQHTQQAAVYGVMREQAVLGILLQAYNTKKAAFPAIFEGFRGSYLELAALERRLGIGTVSRQLRGLMDTAPHNSMLDQMLGNLTAY